MGRLAGSFLAIILSTISESPMNTGSEKDVLCSSRLIFWCILTAREVLEISD